VIAKLAAALLAAGTIAVAASSTPARPADGVCATAVSGPPVTIPWTGRNTTSHLYYAIVWRYRCTTATAYVKRFIRRRSAGLQTKVAGGPRGLACRSLAPKGYTLFQGACKARARGTGFVWTLKLG
jgi:hypothetical protein